MIGIYGNLARYTALFAPRQQGDLGTCTDCSIAYCMEMRAILTGQPAVQLSPIFSAWNQHTQGGTMPVPPGVYGGSAESACYYAQHIGVCEEYLWPFGMIGPDDYSLSVIALQSPPGSLAFADASYHKLTDWVSVYWSDLAGAAQIIESNLAQGYLLSVFKAPNHQLAILDCDPATGTAYGFETLNGTVYADGYDIFGTSGAACVVRGVSFTMPPTVEITPDQAAALQGLSAQLVPWP